MSKNLFKMDSGSWINPDITEGIGRGVVNFTVPAWQGREDRVAIRVVQSGKNMKAVSFRQLGVKVNEVSIDRIDFPIEGGDVQILVTTNAAALKAEITSDNPIACKIKAFTTASGLDMTVNNTKLNYAFPGDPGLEGPFQVSLIVSTPDNSEGKAVEEYITVNGKLIPITIPGKVEKYAKFDTEFKQIESDDSLAQVKISSNIEKYYIEIVECESCDEIEIETDKNVINLDTDGNPEILNITTKPDDLSWRITQ